MFPLRTSIPVLVFLCLSTWVSVPVLAQGGSSAVAERVWDIIKGHDDDGDGIVTRDEFDRDSRAFASYDLDRDGRLTAEEIQRWASARSNGRAGRGGGGGQRGGFGGNRGRGPGRLIGALGDLDADGVVTDGEWKSALDGMSEQGRIPVEVFAAKLEEKGLGRMMAFLLDRIDPDGTGFIDRESVEMMFTRADTDGDGRVEVISTDGARNRPGNPGGGAFGRGAPDTRRGEPAPSVGEVAPDFTLPLADDSQKSVQLSSFVGKKPVALIFGSYT